MMHFESSWIGRAAALLCLALLVGCGEMPAPKQAAKKKIAPATSTSGKKAPQEPPKKQANAATEDPPARSFLPPLAESDKPVKPRPAGSLSDLVKRGEETQFALPELDDGKIAVAGIRKLVGKHLILYTDVPESVEDIQKLPQVFDASVTLLCEYFGVDPAKLNDWKLVGCVMENKARFEGAGLYTADLPDFPNGFHKGSQFWLYNQPSDYYRRHLMIHEGTHAFMAHWLGGAGPPWYQEGMAELLGTHEWDGTKLTLGYNPPDKTLVPYWGRVKIVRDEYAANRGLTLLDIFRFDGQAHLKNEAYGWCWAATCFLNQHPATREAFLELKNDTKDRSIEFSRRFHEKLKPHWADIAEDWQLYVAQLDYGYDVARAATVRKAAAPLPAGGATVSVAADRAWQSTGFEVTAGKTYELTATGRYQMAQEPQPWWSEPNGITIEYNQGQPLGIVLAGVTSPAASQNAMSPLLSPDIIGPSGRITPRATGTLYLRVNDSLAKLADNSGTCTVQVKEVSP
ncbi:hypothetical protein NA78x_000585 [Anatilimnocola sp. NA78]|uniref:hypothetical protein n=1 Tax=Anatilimnocola sp. NA78 TaxID=3415683 RepID=UPI003CE497A1